MFQANPSQNVKKNILDYSTKTTNWKKKFGGILPGTIYWRLVSRWSGNTEEENKNLETQQFQEQKLRTRITFLRTNLLAHPKYVDSLGEQQILKHWEKKINLEEIWSISYLCKWVFFKEEIWSGGALIFFKDFSWAESEFSGAESEFWRGNCDMRWNLTKWNVNLVAL